MGELHEPLLQVIGAENNQKKVTDYSNAGLYSKAAFRWLSPLLQVGSRKTIGRDDVPALAPQDQSAKLYHRFLANWPKQQEPNSVRRTLLKTFWRELLQTAALAACRLSVLFVGPTLIQSFVAVASGNESFANERYLLVLVLVAAKFVEAVSSHQYNFACTKLGMQMKSALMTTVYRKGLRLSSLARQSHGLGPITNHMSVDVQSIADLMINLNNVWIIPAQVLLSGIAMYPVVGLSSLAGFTVLAITGWLSYKNAVFLKNFVKDWAQSRDARMKALVEALASMKIIKLQAWDGKFRKTLEKAREPEFRALTKFTYTVASGIFLIWLSPLATSVAIFATSVWLGRGLSPSMAFTTIATVRILQELLRLLPNTLIAGSQTVISLDRLEKYLWSDELQVDAVVKLPRGENFAIKIEGGSFKWDVESDRSILEDINLNIKPGSLVAVVGRVGSGKTSLLNALQGEIPKVAGTVTTSGSTACANQSAWIQHATIQDGILFGLPMDEVRYKLACDACALQPDLAQLESGDQTEIGEQGINLSGGQKQRIQLARAIYQDSDIYLLDDIFSAVDAQTGSHLFQECVLGALHEKTVVLVTHQVDFLPQADLILVMRDGKIVQSGMYNDILIEGSDFEALIHSHSESVDKITGHQRNKQIMTRDPDVGLSSDSTEDGQHADSIDGGSAAPLAEVDDQTEKDVVTGEHSGEDGGQSKEDAGRLIEDERRETGRVSLGVYWMYFTRVNGGLLITAVLAVQTTWQAALVAGDYWVAYEASFSPEDTSEARRFISIYAALAFLCAILVLMRSVLVGYFGLATAQSLFLGMLKSIFRAPMSFFYTTPNGRIISRATTDQASVDYFVPAMAGALLTVTFQVLGILVVTCLVVWQIPILILPLTYIYWRCQAYYIATARELTRMEGITKAPIISHFSETVTGFTTIRCFQQQMRFIRGNEDRVNSSLQMDFHSNAAAEWVGLRMELIAVLFLFASAIFVILPSSGFINPNYVGLAFAYVLSLNQALYGLVFLVCSLENRMVSVERIGQYQKLPTEAPLSIDSTRPPSSWPAQGTIVLENLKVRYRAESPLVLKGISVTIEGGQTVGIVGRTGSGKSSLLVALFRLVEPAEGQIFIDDVDIGTLGLAVLRSRLSIVPQDPTLFDGTIRGNLDPLELHSDPDIWDALEKCGLASNVRQLEEKLDSSVMANGENWSLGQKQLFCFARVLLKRTRILVLDEATSSVDSETDSLIQKIVRREFAHCTVVSIAHRIASVMDSDKVLVLSAGNAREYGSPSSLLAQPKSIFSALVREYSAGTG